MSRLDPSPAAATEASRLALAGDAVGAIEVLYASGFVDGLVRRLNASWSELDEAAAEDCVAGAVGALYDSIAGGQRIRSAEGYVFKTTQYLARDEHDRRLTEGQLSDDLSAPGRPDGAREASRDTLRTEALRVARSLLPQLGQDNIRRVMAMYLDAIGNGIPDLPARDVAEALHMEAATVRKLKQRGFDRLARLADTMGLTVGLEDIIDNDEFEEDDDDA